MNQKIVWKIDLGALIDQRVQWETYSGIRRIGRLKDVKYHNMTIHGHVVGTPMELVFGEDEAVTWLDIKDVQLVAD